MIDFEKYHIRDDYEQATEGNIDSRTTWKAVPLKSVNGIKFGMTRDSVRKLLGNIKGEFKKSKTSKTSTDNFGVCHVYYDENDKCIAVEIFDDINVSISGKVIFPNGSIKDIMKLPYNFIKEGNGFISKDFSIGISADSEKMTSILFGIKGYYNS